MKVREAPSCPVSIFIAGDCDVARKVCRDLCDMIGLCVTVTPTTYVYTGGEEAGVIIGLINYPRFPSQQVLLEDKAILLAKELREELGQESFSVQTPTTTTWFSWRKEDNQ
jgi:hypothetical protein